MKTEKHTIHFSLEQILNDMFFDAKERTLHSVNRVLHNGLHISIYLDTDGAVLSLSRDRVYPSEQEWRVVCSYLPKGYKAPALPVGEIVNFRHTLRAHLAKEEARQIYLF
jgi:hypothetical protein